MHILFIPPRFSSCLERESKGLVTQRIRVYGSEPLSRGFESLLAHWIFISYSSPQGELHE